MDVFIGLIALVIACILYFWPSLVAIDNNKANKAGIIIINLFLGWTIIFWIVAVIWAYTPDKKVQEEAVQQPAEMRNKEQQPYSPSIQGQGYVQRQEQARGWGQNLPPQMFRCPNCGNIISHSTNPCPYCNVSIRWQDHLQH